MNKIQELWAEDFGYALQVKILNPICSERFNDVIEYLNEYEIHPDASRQLLYIQDKYIFVFFSDLPSNPEPFLEKIKNHFRTCKNGIRNEDYSVEIKPTEEVSETFNGWLLKLIVKLKENELLLTKSSVISKDYIYDFNKENRDKIGKLKIEKNIEKIENEIEKEQLAIDELDKDNIVNDKVIEKGNNELQELNDAYNKQGDLLTRIREERQKKKLIDKNKNQTINEIKDKKLQLIQNIERGKSQLVKSVINEFFKITNDKKDCVSKKVFCDMLNLEHTSKIDIRFLSNILKEHGIEYNRIKIIKGITGAYFGIKLMD
tara:strand:- start:894 stop:1847 length:954 start_codon:yes stop_codon:yes gene_type:complete